MIEVKEEPPTATSPNTKSDMIWDINVEVLKRIFHIDPALLTQNSYFLTSLASFLNLEMPGAKSMLGYFSQIGKTITIVYDPYAPYSQYKNGYKNISGNVIVLNSLDPDNILEEFFHAYWAHTLFRDGVIPEDLRLNAELDAKMYTTFVRCARDNGSASGPLIHYLSTMDIFAEHYRNDYDNYHGPGGYLKEYKMDHYLYQELYDQFEIDVRATDSEYSEFYGNRYFTEGRFAIFYLLNVHPN